MIERIRISTEKPKPASGHDASGRFAKGNKCARNHGVWGLMHKLRAAVVKSVSLKDVQQIVAKLVERAKGGDPQATRLVFDYAIGKPESLDLLGRLSELEDLVARKIK